MKNLKELEKFDVQEMNTTDLQLLNGGLLGALLVTGCLGLVAMATEVTIDFFDKRKAKKGQ